MFRKNSKKIKIYVARISEEFNIDKSTIEYFITNEMERILDGSKNVHKIQLELLEDEIAKVNSDSNIAQIELDKKRTQLDHLHNNHRNSYKKRLEDLDKLKVTQNDEIELLTRKIQKIEDEIELVGQTLISKKQRLDELSKKEEELSLETKEAVKEVKQKEYNLMMDAQAIKERTDPTHKKIAVFLSILTVIGILLALYFILNKN
jgi:chromosome segregation ATPase